MVIIDSMGKWGTAWPHFGHDRTSKEMDTLVRPKMVLTGALAHGWGTFLFGAAEHENHGSAALLIHDVVHLQSSVCPAALRTTFWKCSFAHWRVSFTWPDARARVCPLISS